MIRGLLKGLAAFELMLCAYALGQSWESRKIAVQHTILEPPVSFLQEAPTIDGILDPSLHALPVRNFSAVHWKTPNAPVSLTYRLAYGTQFLYLYVEGEADHLVFNDRAYQNGDGFVMLIGKARPANEPTDEFYELACSAVNKSSLEWTRRIFWNYNVDKLFVPTSDDTKLEFREGGGKICFELLVPWSDVRPYHPWISGGIGFNLTFTKGFGSGGKAYSVVVEDPATGAEFKKRLYSVLQFEKPNIAGKPQSFVSILEGHINEGDPLNAIAVTATDTAVHQVLHVRIVAGEGKPVMSQLLDQGCARGLTSQSFVVATPRIPEGGYTVRWESMDKGSRGFTGLSILRNFEPEKLAGRLDKVHASTPRAHYSTIQFLIQELDQKLKGLKPNETCLSERFNAGVIQRMLSGVERGADPFEGKRGFLRKAYRSKVDSTLQPYVVYLPANLEPGKRYPLFVYLHGSASYETNIQDPRGLIPEGFIALGPLGRGPSNGYSRDHAQEDIAEAIDAVRSEYPVDSTRIVLGGFSMGGYGVYRTFHETPWKFRGLAIFSGGPSMGKRYAPDANPPDFKDDRTLKVFRGMPVFVFHGEGDRNVPITDTRELVEKLIKAGARVEFFVDPAKGHEMPGRDGMEAFARWSAGVIAGRE